MPEGAAAVLEYLRHDDNRTERKRGESSKLRGMVIAATGAGIMSFGLSFRDGMDCYWWGSFPSWSELSCWFMHSESCPEQETRAKQTAVLTTSNRLPQGA